MNISGIRPSAGFYDYNSITSQKVSTESLLPVQAGLDAAEVDTSAAVEVSTETADDSQARSRQTFGAYDYAEQYDARATYDMVGADSDIHSLDVTKAVSDMQKDELLHQYQYFVGQELSVGTQMNPSMRGAENFSL